MYYFQIIFNLISSKIWVFLSIVHFKLRGISFGKGLKVSGKYYLLNHPKSNFFLGNNVRINSGVTINPFGGENMMIIVIGKNAILNIGNNVGISNASIHCYKEILIEDDVYIGGGVKIFDTDFHSINYCDRLLKPDFKAKKARIIIKKGAFIGGYSIIGKGVSIGERSVIGAGSVVTKNIPDDEVWAGNPAVHIKKII